ncbi:hypothetical protein EYF80_023217 [Liparis tanakae]|uniref:Uncharacterized protein n=1 Tax=Liparis tanakae TaxID=230148 RepID=A0A4Z2HLX5_9TELE|nr:hypothetical protein EYF80_023217 [Liparis tanakae]
MTQEQTIQQLRILEVSWMSRPVPYGPGLGAERRASGPFLAPRRDQQSSVDRWEGDCRTARSDGAAIVDARRQAAHGRLTGRVLTSSFIAANNETVVTDKVKMRYAVRRDDDVGLITARSRAAGSISELALKHQS